MVILVQNIITVKKTILFAMLAACATQLKAQRLNKVPGNNPVDKLFKTKPFIPDSSFSKFIPVLPQNGHSNNNGTLLKTSELIAGETVYSRMPIVRTYLNDNMPMVKINEPGMKYHMLIKRLDVINADSAGVKKRLNP